MDFQESRSFQNLQSAYEYELESIGKYDIFSRTAEEQVLIEISLSFDRVSTNSLFIAERLRNIINDGEPGTEQNLEEASQVEVNAANMYREYALIAREEGFNELDALFGGIANIKLNHNLMFEDYTININTNQLFCKPQERLWICLGCGNILNGECAPEVCPICLLPQSYYAVYA